MKDVLEIGVTPGLISALAFLLFDIILLTMFDVTMARWLSSFYYRLIFRNGYALNIRSADVPCITNFLLSSRLDIVNIVVLLSKVAVLVVMLYVDLSINSQVKYPVAALKSTNGFDLSEAKWNRTDNSRRAVTRDEQPYLITSTVDRRWEKVGDCRQIGGNEDNFNIVFYNFGYNLKDNVVLNEESQPMDLTAVPVNDTTVTCLKPGLVEQPVVLAVVRGCSAIRDAPCPASASITITIALSFDWEHFAVYYEVVMGTFNLSLVLFEFNSEVWNHVFPHLADTNATLTCARTQSSFPERTHSKRRERKRKARRLHTSCIFVVNANKTTLIEKWRYDHETTKLVRDFPGPLFDSDIEIGISHKANLLFMIMWRDVNWLALASVVIKEGAIYRHLNQKEITTIRQPRTVTVISYAAVFATVALSIVIIALHLAVKKILATDNRPQLNSIDGLSSIAREQTAPSGSSIFKGSTCFLGFMHNKNGSLRFGPLSNLSLAARPIKDVDII